MSLLRGPSDPSGLALAFLNAGPNSPTIGMDTGNESLFELRRSHTPTLFLILTHWSKGTWVCHTGYFGVNEACSE